jgi:hypothetical protein
MSCKVRILDLQACKEAHDTIKGRYQVVTLIGNHNPLNVQAHVALLTVRMGKLSTNVRTA